MKTYTYPVMCRGFAVIKRSPVMGVAPYTKADLPVYIAVSGSKRVRNSPPERCPVSFESLAEAIERANGNLNVGDLHRYLPRSRSHSGRTLLGPSIVSQLEEQPWDNLLFRTDKLVGMKAIFGYNTPPATDQRLLLAKAGNLYENDPIPVNPNWPASRSLARLLELGGEDLVDHLEEGDIWLDIGCATACGLGGYNGNISIEKAGVNLHGYETPAGVQVLQAHIPFNPIVHTVYGRRVKLLTDFYAAVSHGDDPIAALLYEASLLGPGGKAVIVTEVERFGEPITWKKIERFFELGSGQKIKFETFETFADANQVMEKALRITIEGQGMPIFPTRISEYVPFMFGTPEKTRVLWQSPDGAATIWRVDYKVMKRVRG